MELIGRVDPEPWPVTTGHPTARVMSETLDRIRDLKGAGSASCHTATTTEIIALQAVWGRAGRIETVLIHDEHEALAACAATSDPTTV